MFLPALTRPDPVARALHGAASCSKHRGPSQWEADLRAPRAQALPRELAGCPFLPQLPEPLLPFPLSPALMHWDSPVCETFSETLSHLLLTQPETGKERAQCISPSRRPAPPRAISGSFPRATESFGNRPSMHKQARHGYVDMCTQAHPPHGLTREEQEALERPRVPWLSGSRTRTGPRPLGLCCTELD